MQKIPNTQGATARLRRHALYSRDALEEAERNDDAALLQADQEYHAATLAADRDHDLEEWGRALCDEWFYSDEDE